MNTKLLVFIDPSYNEEYGHFSNIKNNIANACLEENVDLLHYTQEYKTNKTTTNTRTIFEDSAFLNENMDWYYIDSKIFKFSYSFRKILIEIDNVTDRYDEIVIYMYTAHILHIKAISDVMGLDEFKDVNIQIKPVIFYLDNDFCLDKEPILYRELLLKTSLSLEQNDPCNKITVCMDSDLGKNKYQKYFERPLEILPIALSNVQTYNKNLTKKRDNAKIKIGYFGAANYRHGYQHILDCYLKLIENYNDDFELVLRSFKADEVEKILLSKHHKVLVNKNNIIEFDNFLTQSELTNLMASCDLILLPYSIISYPVQTSGFFVESLLLHKVVVVSEKTWMSSKLKKFGSGLTFNPNEKNDLYVKVCQIIDNLEYYQDSTSRNIDKFKLSFDANKLVRSLFKKSIKINKPNIQKIIASLRTDFKDNIETLLINEKNKNIDLRRWLEKEKYEKAEQRRLLEKEKYEKAEQRRWLEKEKHEKAELRRWLEKEKHEKADLRRWLEKEKLKIEKIYILYVKIRELNIYFSPLKIKNSIQTLFKYINELKESK